MIPIAIDVETFWSATHSLSKMSPILYCLHPDTELISLAYKIGEKPTECIFGEADMQAWADTIDWSDVLAIGHNMSAFDAMLLAWRLGVKPRQWGCTLAMARPIHGKDVGGSLAALVKHYQLGVKDQAVLHQTKGRHLAEFTAQERFEMAKYNKADVEQTWALFKKLLPHTPKEELALIDLTTRMLVNPQFDVDLSLLQRGLTAERTRKRRTLLALGQTLGVTGLDDDAIADQVSTILMSAPKFSALLTEQGVAVPTKISPTTGKEAPALAKTDQEFLDLQEHDNPIVAAAAMARLGTRSTILETRFGALIDTANACGGKLPIPLRYWGAATGRWSGDMGLNLQNLPRVNPSKPAVSDVLRLSLQAPPGHQIVVVDLSGIELRMNHFLWKVPSSMALFQASPDKADLYKDFASTLYDVPLEEVTKSMRQIGKIAHLGLGYSSGPSTFQRIAKMMGGVELDDGEAVSIVGKWREEYQPIVQGWTTCQGAVWAMASGREIPIDPWGLCRTGKDCIHLPKGVLRYPELRQEWSDKTQRQEWVYGKGRNKSKIYGGLVVENLCQALSRTVMADVILAFARTPLGQRYPLAHCVHDEVVYVVRDDDAEAVLAAVSQLMRTPPSWFPALITWSEGSYASRYGLAK